MTNDHNDFNDRDDHATGGVLPQPIVTTGRRAVILALAQEELHRGVRGRRRRRAIAAWGGVAGAVAMALVVGTVMRRPAEIMGADGVVSDRLAGGERGDAGEDGDAGAVDRSPFGEQVSPNDLAPPASRRPMIEIVRQATPSPGVVSIVDDREFESLLRTLDHPVGLAVIDGEARLISSAR